MNSRLGNPAFTLLVIFLVSLAVAGCATSFPMRGPASDSTPLFKMMGQEVVVKSGDIPRTDVFLGTGELATERSQASQDPSPELGYHFELAHPASQEKQSRQGLLTPAHQVRGAGYEREVKRDPSALKFWGLHSGRFISGKIRPEDGPTLVNNHYEYIGISDRTYGYCWGFSTLVRYFTEVAFFDETAPSGVPAYKWKGFAENEKWFLFYQPIIDRILEGKAEVIPGFADFRAFSKVPEIEFYLKLKAMQLWSDRALRLPNMSTFFSSTKPLNEVQITSLLDDLQTRLGRGELTKILFTAKDSSKVLGGSTDVHSVLVTGLDRTATGSARIHLWDIDFYAEDINKDDKFIEVRVVPGKPREVHYAPWWEPKSTPEKTYSSTQLGSVRIAPENDGELKTMLGSLREFCSAPVNSRYCR